MKSKIISYSFILIIQTCLFSTENEKSDFLSPGDPIVIVKKITKEVIEETIQAYAEDYAY